MIFLNTFWTWQYIAMLFFVFWTLWLLSGLLADYRPFDVWHNRGVVFGRLIWAALGTFFFHSVW